jgi:hypothetical protein
LKKTALIIGVAMAISLGMGGREWYKVAMARHPLVRKVGFVAPARPGHELTLIVVGSSICGGAQDPRLIDGVRRLRTQVEKVARERGERSVSIGVALDYSLPKGLNWLARFDAFDEVVVGRNWLNMAAERYFWQRADGKAGVPQVIVTSRSIDETHEKRLHVGEERVLATFAGVDAILKGLDGVTTLYAENIPKTTEPDEKGNPMPRRRGGAR